MEGSCSKSYSQYTVGSGAIQRRGVSAPQPTPALRSRQNYSPSGSAREKTSKERLNISGLFQCVLGR